MPPFCSLAHTSNGYEHVSANVRKRVVDTKENWETTLAARKENLLLAALGCQERERLEPFLRWVKVQLSEVLIPNKPSLISYLSPAAARHPAVSG